MKRLAALALIAPLITLPGCIIIDDSSAPIANDTGRVSRAGLSRIVAANTRNRIGEDRDTVLARYPDDNVSLIHSSVNAGGEEVAVYRVYARTSSTRFERYLVFEGGRLALLTDDRDDIASFVVPED